MDEMNAKWAIYRKILGQNSHWKMILPLEKHPSLWIKPRFNLGRQMHDRWRRTWFGPLDHVEGSNKKLMIFHHICRFFADILRYFSHSINLHEILCQRPPIHDISTIYLRYILTFSSMLLIGFYMYNYTNVPSNFMNLCHTPW